MASQYTMTNASQYTMTKSTTTTPETLSLASAAVAGRSLSSSCFSIRRRTLVYAAVFIVYSVYLMLAHNSVINQMSSITKFDNLPPVVDKVQSVRLLTGDGKAVDKQNAADATAATTTNGNTNVVLPGVENSSVKQDQHLKSVALSSAVVRVDKPTNATPSAGVLLQQNTTKKLNLLHNATVIGEAEVRQWFDMQPQARSTKLDSLPRLSRSEWSNQHNLVHVITTRFMQHQAELEHLAQARLELFKAITLPSLQKQTNQDFIWILRIDPQLDAATLTSLLNATERMDNVVIHKTLYNPEGFRTIPKERYTQLANPKSRLLLDSYIEAAQTRTVLETRLDADDALMVNFVEQLQQEAKRQFDLADDEWAVWCVADHLEWQQNSPWQANTSAFVGWKAPHCVTPGLTWGYPVTIVRDNSLAYEHQKLHLTVPGCLNDTLHRKGKCLHRLRSNWPMALRARTITSAGMADLVLDQKQDPLALLLNESHWSNLQESMSAHTETIFGISPHALHFLRQHLVEHMHDIAVDALKGQCTKGHSCKPGSKIALLHLVAETA